MQGLVREKRPHGAVSSWDQLGGEKGREKLRLRLSVGDGAGQIRSPGDNLSLGMGG